MSNIYDQVGSTVGDASTIVAQSTPAGRSAIAVVRLSGPSAHAIARRHLSPFPPRPRIVELATFAADGEVLDRPLVTRFDAPHSYTGEDVVEISTHGGLLSPARIIAQLVLSGARPAEPGEFTRRAFLNGKLDLLQAEAVGDMIDASSRGMHQAAVRQLDGGLSRRIEAMRSAILDVEALLAYDIDFPEEDAGPISPARITAAAQDVVDRIDQLLATAPAGEVLRAGAVVVIAGPPNVGKSSLFNALVGRARAIVTDVPGTTRDAIEAVVEGGRWPLRLVDTAGLRDTSDPVERLGVELSQRHLAVADVVLACGDTTQAVNASLEAVRVLDVPAPVIAVHTKGDLVAIDYFAGAAVTSAETGAGLRELIDRIDLVLDQRLHAPPPDTPLLTRARHRAALEQGRAEMLAFLEAWAARELPATVVASYLRGAVGALTELIGTVDVEDVLGRLFAEFCVGK